jgi:hypothetical protein
MLRRQKQEIATFNIPGAFLHTDNNDYVVMKMNGSLATLMVKKRTIDLSKIRNN